MERNFEFVSIKIFAPQFVFVCPSDAVKALTTEISAALVLQSSQRNEKRYGATNAFFSFFLAIGNVSLNPQ